VPTAPVIMIEFLPQTSLMAAFLAGFLSFVSPCVLPLVPSYLICITGLSLEQLIDSAERNRLRKSIVINALLFITGFSLVFTAFGASASLIGQFMTDQQHLIRKIGGILIVLFGLYLLGIVKLKFLTYEKRVHFRSRPAGYLGSVLIGVTFAAAWTPCVGPVLGSMLLYASTTDRFADGVTLLVFYSLGLGLPLFATAMGVDRSLVYFKQVRSYVGVISTISGVFLIVFGLIVYSDSLSLLTAFFERHGIGSDLSIEGG
jgi:cytochrome c-type biogenesis protein